MPLNPWVWYRAKEDLIVYYIFIMIPVALFLILKTAARSSSHQVKITCANGKIQFLNTSWDAQEFDAFQIGEAIPAPAKFPDIKRTEVRAMHEGVAFGAGFHLNESVEKSAEIINQANMLVNEGLNKSATAKAVYEDDDIKMDVSAHTVDEWE